jgi:hypothetical protein
MDLLDTFGKMDIPSEDNVNINLRLYSETSLQNLPNVAKSSSSSHFIVDYDDSRQAINLFNMVSTLSKDLGKCFDLVVQNLVIHVLEVNIHTVSSQGENIAILSCVITRYSIEEMVYFNSLEKKFVTLEFALIRSLKEESSGVNLVFLKGNVGIVNPFVNHSAGYIQKKWKCDGGL